MNNKITQRHFSLNCNGHLVPLKIPVVMGILNYTYDSFYDGGHYITDDAIVKRAAQILEEGATFIDIGAVSTRPGAAELNETTEIVRIKHAVNLILKEFPEALISIDTWRASVARMAVGEGACFINDISGGTFDPDLFHAVADLQVPYCLMHTTAKPDVMQQQTSYTDLMTDILQFLGQKVAILKELGVKDIVIDPGFGFGKTLEQNYTLMHNLEAFHIFDLPLLAGISHKSMIYNLLDTSPAHALNGTTVLNTVAIERGVHILRVHEVREAMEVIKIVGAISQ